MLLRPEIKVVSLCVRELSPQLINLSVVAVNNVRETFKLLLIVLHHIVNVILQLKSVLFKDLELSLELDVLVPSLFVFTPLRKNFLLKLSEFKHLGRFFS